MKTFLHSDYVCFFDLFKLKQMATTSAEDTFKTPI